ncbi:Cyanovirin-N [Rhypophila sp. PSN 637]
MYPSLSKFVFGLYGMAKLLPTALCNPVPSPVPMRAQSTIEDRATNHTETLLKRSFAATCIRCFTNGVWLTCNQCNDRRGGQIRTDLALDDCIANDRGVLRWRRGAISRGRFTASCRYFGQNRGTMVLVASCADGSGGWKDASINLDERIHNWSGRLGCDVSA